MEEDKKYYTVAVLSKACQVIETLATKNSFELNELCKAVNLPKTTVHRILLTLCDEGYVSQSRGGVYALSYKFFSIGKSVINRFSISDIAKPYMSELLNKFNETVNLCVASGIDMVIIDKCSTLHTLKPDNIVGTSFAIYYSASGKAYLGFMPKDNRSFLLNKILTETKPEINPEVHQNFMQELDLTQKTGIAYDNEEIYEGVRCLATPILNYDNVPVAALSVSAPTVRLAPETLISLEKELLLMAKNISLQLGSSYPYDFV